MVLLLLFFSIDQLSEVIRNNIEAGAKLQYELVLVCKAFQSDFYFWVLQGNIREQLSYSLL